MSAPVARGRQIVTGTRPVSELLFEQYLSEQGLDFDYEPKIPGKKKHLDYRLRELGLFCEVKELHARLVRPERPAAFDPYAGIRKEIHEVRRQFKEYKEHCCVLVIHNIDDWEFRERPLFVFGAMLGNVGIRYNVSLGGARAVRPKVRRNVFLDGGKMIDSKSRRPQNTTISAVVLLSKFAVPNPEFERAYERRKTALQSRLGAEPTVARRVEIRMELYEHLPVTLGQRPRVEVFKNPLARIELPDRVFRGPYDAGYEFKPRLRRIERVYAGQKLCDAEALRGGGDLARRIEHFQRAIVEYFAPQRIVLFGSHGVWRPGAGFRRGPCWSYSPAMATRRIVRWPIRRAPTVRFSAGPAHALRGRSPPANGA